MEEEGLTQELVTKHGIKECGFCKERDRNTETYDEGIEWEKERECQKALEREKMLVF